MSVRTSGRYGGRNGRGARVAWGMLAALGLLLAGAPLAGQNASMPELEYLTTWTPRIQPNDIAHDPESGDLAVVDAGHGRIEILRPGGTHRTFRLRYDDPRAAAFLPGGVLLVAEAGTGSVNGYDAAERVVLTLGAGAGEFQAPNDVVVHPAMDRIYVVDSAAHAVRAYRTDGTFEFQFGSQGRGAGQLDWPISIAVDAELGHLFVADFHNRRIAAFTEDGMFLRNFGRKGKRDDSMGFLGGVCADGAGRLYVAQSLGGFLQVFTTSGQYLGTIAEHGAGPGQLRAVKSILIDGYGRLLATSYLDRRIELWGMEDHEHPQDILVSGSAVPSPINRGHREFKVVLEFEGIVPGEEEVDPASFRLNGSVEPIPGSYGDDPKRVVRFPTAPLFRTLPAEISGPVTLTLSGLTTAGNRFETVIPIKVVPDAQRGR